MCELQKQWNHCQQKQRRTGISLLQVDQLWINNEQVVFIGRSEIFIISNVLVKYYTEAENSHSFTYGITKKGDQSDPTNMRRDTFTISRQLQVGSLGKNEYIFVHFHILKLQPVVHS